MHPRLSPFVREHPFLHQSVAEDWSHEMTKRFWKRIARTRREPGPRLVIVPERRCTCGKCECDAVEMVLNQPSTSSLTTSTTRVFVVGDGQKPGRLNICVKPHGWTLRQGRGAQS